MAARLAQAGRWDGLVARARGTDGRAWAMEGDERGLLALHFAAVYQAPLEVVRALLDAYPEGAQTTDNDGMLPLHHAALNDAPVEVVCALLDAYPQGAQTTKNDGWLPLHDAAFNDAPVVGRALRDQNVPGSKPF